MYTDLNILHFDFIYLLIDIWVIINYAMNMCIQIVLTDPIFNLLRYIPRRTSRSQSIKQV